MRWSTLCFGDYCAGGCCAHQRIWWLTPGRDTYCHIAQVDAYDGSYCALADSTQRRIPCDGAFCKLAYSTGQCIPLAGAYAGFHRTSTNSAPASTPNLMGASVYYIVYCTLRGGCLPNARRTRIVYIACKLHVLCKYLWGIAGATWAHRTHCVFCTNLYCAQAQQLHSGTSAIACRHQCNVACNYEISTAHF